MTNLFRSLFLTVLIFAGGLIFAPAAKADTVECTLKNGTILFTSTADCQSQGGTVSSSSGGSTGIQPSGGGSTGIQPSSGGSTGTQPSGGSGLQNYLSSNSLTGFLGDILDLVVNIGSVVVVLMVVYVGFLFATAGGKEEQIRRAREALFWTVIGALLLLGAKAIALGIQATVQALGSGS